ncbi:LOW QUALITY PROTEIN: zinc finger protein 106 [Lethenteron reissneri]|uniref:LOW QUALITY PROTEIN: zinc finger protein 106 n=1 Tax=Lethenteron reissneri TaxID=7753 RepID=UPI002AB6AB18|nr:LOW QUALITY PROTEIN: zinc finger protein 106 [Lethenteron reissneri]
MSKQLKCGLCRVHCANTKEFEEHIRSMLHHRELETVEGRACTHHCRVCCANVVGLSAYASHLSSPEHKKRVEKSSPGSAYRELPPPDAAQTTAQRDDAKKPEERSLPVTDTTKQVPFNNNRFHPRPNLEKAKKMVKEATNESKPKTDKLMEQPRSHTDAHPAWTGATSNGLKANSPLLPPPGVCYQNRHHKRQPFSMRGRGGAGGGRGYGYNYNHGPNRYWQDFRYPPQRWHNDQNYKHWPEHLDEGNYNRGMQDDFTSDELPPWFDREENAPFHQHVDRGKMKPASRFTRWTPYPSQKNPNGHRDQEMMPEEVKQLEKVPPLKADELPKISFDKSKTRVPPNPTNTTQGGSRVAPSGTTARSDPARGEGTGSSSSRPSVAASQGPRTTTYQSKGAVPLSGKQQRRESLSSNLRKVRANLRAGPSQHKPPAAVRATEKHSNCPKNKATQKDDISTHPSEVCEDPPCLTLPSLSLSSHRPSSAPSALLKLDEKPGDAAQRVATHERPWSAGASGSTVGQRDSADLAKVDKEGVTANSADANRPTAVEPNLVDVFKTKLAGIVDKVSGIRSVHKQMKERVPQPNKACRLGIYGKSERRYYDSNTVNTEATGGSPWTRQNKETSHSQPFSNDCTGGKPPQEKNLPSPSGKEFGAQGGDETNQSPALDMTSTDATVRLECLSAAITNSVTNVRPAHAESRTSETTTEIKIETAPEAEIMVTAALASDKHTGDCVSSEPEAHRCPPALAQAELSRLGVSTALQKELSRYLAARGTSGSKPGTAAPEPNLNQARRRMRPGGTYTSGPVPSTTLGKGPAVLAVSGTAGLGGAEAQRKPEVERESCSLRPAIQQLLSAPRRNVDWEQIVQVLSKRRQAKGLPRFGIEMGPANKDDPLDPAFLNFDELGDFPELYDLNLDDFLHKEQQFGTKYHSDNPVEPASEPRLACATAGEAAASVSGTTTSSSGRVPQLLATLEHTPNNTTNEKHLSENGMSASRPLRTGVTTTTTMGDLGSEGPPVNTGAAATPRSLSGVLLANTPEVGSPSASPISPQRPLGAQVEGEPDILTDSSFTSGPEPSGGQARKKRRATAEGSSPEVPEIERKNKRMKVKGLKKDRQHVDELLSVSLREEELSRGMQELEPTLEHAKAALHSAFLHVQELLLHKQQITMEMDKLRSYRIQILQGMQDKSVNQLHLPSAPLVPPAATASPSLPGPAGVSHPLLIKQEAGELTPVTACTPPMLNTALYPGSFLPPSPLLQQCLPAATRGEAGVPTATTPPATHYFTQPQEVPWRRPPLPDGIPETMPLRSSRLSSPARSNMCTPVSKSLASTPHDSSAETTVAPTGTSAGPAPTKDGAESRDSSVKRNTMRTRARAGVASEGSAEAGRVGNAAEEPGEDDDSTSTQKRKRLKKRKPARARVPETSDTEQEALTRPVRRLKTRRGSRQGKSTSQASGTVSPCGVGDVPVAQEEPRLARPPSSAALHKGEEDDEGMDSPDGNHVGGRQSEPDSSLELVEPPTPEILSIDDSSDNEATKLPKCLTVKAAARGQTPAAARGQTPAAARGQTPAAARGQTPAAARGQTPAAARGRTSAAVLGEAGRANSVEVSSTSDLWQRKSPRLVAESLKKDEDHQKKSSTTDSHLCEPTAGAFEGHEAAVSGIQIFEGMLYTCSSDKTVRAFDLETRQCLRTFNGHTSKVNALLVTVAGGNASQPRLYTGASDHTIRCYNVREERCVEEFSVLDRVLCLHERWDVLYAGLANGTVVSISTQSNKFLDTFECHGPRAVSCVASSQEGSRRLLLVGSYDATISVRDARSGLFLRALDSHTKTVLCMQVVNDLVFSGSSDQSVHAHNIHTGELLRIYKGHTHAITAISILGKVMLTACLDKLVRVYELESHDRLQVYGGHKDMVMCMAVHKSMIYTGCYDGSVQAVTLNLVSNFRCWWHKCCLMFGVLDHLKEHIRSTHLNADAQSALCRWRDCDAFFTAKNRTIHELVPHLCRHAELDSQPQKE